MFVLVMPFPSNSNFELSEHNKNCLSEIKHDLARDAAALVYIRLLPKNMTCQLQCALSQISDAMSHCT